MSNIVQLVEQQQESFVPVIADNSVSWEKEAKFAIQAFNANDFLAKAALNNPESAKSALINVAAIGISLNPALKHAYLIPRSIKKNGQWIQTVCLDVSYMGLLHLAMETGSILWGQAVIVHERDDFQLTGLGSMPHHKYSPFGDRGQIIGVYCTVKTCHGDYLTECMSIEDVFKIRLRSESFKKGYGPWISDEGEMIRKTVVKRANKYWPKVERLSQAIDYLNNVNGEGIEKEPVMPHAPQEAIEAEQQKVADQLQDKVEALMQKMEQCETSEQLKATFAEAYQLTKGNPLQKNVQIEYQDQKVKFDV
jgi:recombination protein RecT